MLTIETLIDEMYQFHNDVVIVSDRIARLLGIGNDGDDYYYICSHINWPDGDIMHHTCVGHCESLKGKISDQHYKSLDSVLTLNGAPKTEKFQLDIDPNRHAPERIENDKRLQEIFSEE